MERTYRVLVAAQTAELNEVIENILKENGIEAVCTTDSKTMFDKFGKEKFDLVVLWPGLSESKGEELFDVFSGVSDIPVIILGEPDDEEELKAFKRGCDDYIRTPFSPEIFCARVKALLMRYYSRVGKFKENMRFDKLRVNHYMRTAYVSGREIELTKKEFDLLYLFVTNPNIVFSREQLIQSVWSDTEINDIRTVDTHVKQLRTKLRECKGYIHTVWGVGYKFYVKNNGK